MTTDRDEGDVLRYVLERHGHTAVVESCVSEGPLEMSADLVVLDFAACGSHGAARCRQLSAQGLSVLALVDGGKGAVAAALDSGADDSILRPFSYAEFLARVRAIGRRATSPSDVAALQVGELQLWPGRFEVRYKGRPVRLSPTEFRVLHFLTARAGQVVRADELVREVWGYDESNPDLVRVNIYRVRQKLETDPRQPRLLRSVPGVGFVLDVTGAAS